MLPDNDKNRIEFVIQAKDIASNAINVTSNSFDRLRNQATLVSRSLIGTGSSLQNVSNSADVARKRISETSAEIVRLGESTGKFLGSSLTSLSGLFSVFQLIERELSNPVVADFIEKIKINAEEATKETAILSDTLKELSSISSTVSVGFGQGFSESFSSVSADFADGFINKIFKEVSPAIDTVDTALSKVVKTLSDLSQKVPQALNTFSGLPATIAGVGTPLEIFSLLESSVGGFAQGVATVSDRIIFFSQSLTSLQQLAANGPFQLLIGQTVELREQLLATQASLVGTSNIFDGLTGQRIDDPTKAILSLTGPIKGIVRELERESLELVGVTSKELIPLFDQVASRITSVGGGLSDAKDLALDFAASLSTLNIPLFQSQQEISSILTGQIDQNSALAKALNITNEQVNKYKEQGRLVEELRKRLSAFRSGNALAAESLSGVSSNVIEIFDNIGQYGGEKLLDPLVKEITDVYNFLRVNEQQLTEYIASVADEILRIGLAFTDAVRALGRSLGGLVSEAPMFIFKSLANAAEAFAQSIKFVLEVLGPTINALTAFSKVAFPLAGPFLKLFFTMKTLATSVQVLSKLFSLLGQAVPGVGEAMYALDLRANGLVNQFGTLNSIVGSGASGFLLLGKNLESIPGAVDILSNALGPLGGVLVGFIPAIATVGVQLVGLIKLFPPIGAFFSNFLGLAPGLLAQVAAFASTNKFLAPLSGLFTQAANAVAVYATATDRSALVNAQFRTVLLQVGKAIAGQVLAFGLLAGGAFLAFQAIDKFILQNETVKEVIGAVVTGLTDFASAIGTILLNPVNLAVAAIAALTIGIRVGLIPALSQLIAVQFATWLSAAAGAANFLSTSLAAFKLVGLSTALTQVGVGLQALSIFFTQGATAATVFLKANGVAAVATGGLRVSLLASVASFKAFIASTYAASIALAKDLAITIAVSVTNLYNTVAASLAASGGFLGLAKSVVLASAAMAKDLLKAIPVAIAQLKALGFAAGSTTFSFKVLGASILAIALKSLKSLTTFVVSGVSGLLGLGGAAGAASANFTVLSTSLSLVLGKILILLAPLGLLAAGIAAIGLVRYTKNLAESTEATEEYARQTSAASEQSLELATKIKQARDIQAEADKRGVRLTDEQFKANDRLLKQSENQQKSLDDQIKTLKEAQKEAIGKENKRNIEQQIAELERMKTLLSDLGANVKITPRDLEVLGSTFEQLANKVRGAEEAINNPSGDADVFKKKAEELVALTQRQLELGQISAEESRRRFALVASNIFTDQELQIKAQEAITESFKKETERRVGMIQTQQTAIAAQLSAGALEFEQNAAVITDTQTFALRARAAAEFEAHQVRLKQIAAELEAERFKAAETLKFKLQIAESRPESEEGKAAKSEAEELRKQLVEIENRKNTELNKAAQENGEEQIRINKAITEVENQNARFAIELRRQVNAGIITEEQAAEKQLTAARKVELNAQLEDTKASFAERKKITEKQFDEQSQRVLKQIREKQAEADKIPENTPEFEAAQTEIVGFSNTLTAIAKARNATLGNIEREYVNEISKTKAELQKTDAEGVRKQNDLEIQELERSQREALDVLQSAQNERLIATQELENKGKVRRTQVAEQRAQEARANLDEQLELERSRVRELEALPEPKNQKDRISLEAQIRAARLKTQDLIKQSLDAERQEYEAHIEAIKDAIQVETNAVEVGFEQRRRLGEAEQQEIDRTLAERRVKALEKELELETKNISKRSQLALDLEKAKTALVQAGIAERLDELNDAATEENIILTRQLREGQISESRANTAKARQRVRLLQEELRLEANNADKRKEIELSLEEALSALFAAGIAERKSLLETQNLEYQNQIEEQNQLIRRQQDLYSTLSQALENRNRILEASKNLAQAAANFVTGELDVLSQIERSEFRRRQLAEITAALKLEALRQQQKFERESLEIQIAQNKLALEREIIQNRINQSQKLAGIAQTSADIEVAQLDPANQSRGGQARLRALQLKLSADIAEFEQLQQQGGLINQQRATQAEVEQSQRRQIQLNQRLEERRALGDLVQALPPGRQQQAARALQEKIAKDFGFDNVRDLRESGLARSRQLAGREFGVSQSPDILSAIDPELGGLSDVLSGKSFGAALSDVQRTFGSRFGSTANITGALTPNPKAAPLQLMPEFSGSVRLPSPQERGAVLGLENSGQLFQQGVDKLVDFISKQGGSATSYNIKIEAPTGKATANGKTTVEPSLENVLKLTKQLAGG